MTTANSVSSTRSRFSPGRASRKPHVHCPPRQLFELLCAWLALFWRKRDVSSFWSNAVSAARALWISMSEKESSGNIVTPLFRGSTLKRGVKGQIQWHVNREHPSLSHTSCLSERYLIIIWHTSKKTCMSAQPFQFGVLLNAIMPQPEATTSYRTTPQCTFPTIGTLPLHLTGWRKWRESQPSSAKGVVVAALEISEAKPSLCCRTQPCLENETSFVKLFGIWDSPWGPSKRVNRGREWLDGSRAKHQWPRKTGKSYYPPEIKLALVKFVDVIFLV